MMASPVTTDWLPADCRDVDINTELCEHGTIGQLALIAVAGPAEWGKWTTCIFKMAIPGQLLDSIDHYVMSLSMLQTFVRIICILGSLLQLLSSLTLTGHTGDVV